jgi:hypothetical protein
MVRKLLAAVTATAIITFASMAWAQSQFGTAAEAKALLEKAVAAVKADKGKALADFNNPAGGFRDRDLYVFCSGSDGIVTAHPTLKGQQIRDLVDKNGKRLGEAILAAAKEGVYNLVDYMWPRPGADATPVKKFTYVTMVGDQVCAVGYYES